jgi:dinuclear metal center YbgI/SA1388 family protein
MQRDELIDWLDWTLDTGAFQDASINGLQVEGAAEISKIAVATDACQATIEGAVAAGAQLLIVHHGLFWGQCEVIKGAHGRRVRAAVKADLNLYCSHLPLDAHPELGNNALLAALLELEEVQPWGGDPARPIGVRGLLSPPLAPAALARKLEEALGAPVRVLPFGPDPIRSVGIISGAAGKLVDQGLHDGLDAVVTGEPRYGQYFLAEEGGINLLFAGHYATETAGVKALAQRIQDQHGLPWVFLDHPTGL